MNRTHLGHTPELDGIRGWACASVLIAHCLTGVAKGPWMQAINQHTLWIFLSGVDLFFVLSGFLIGGILLDSKGQSHYFKTFWIKRVARIFPVAYLVLATYAVALFITAQFGITRFDNWLLAEYRPPLWTFATFTQSIPIAFGGYGGPRWMAMTWSLAIEEQFYLLFPLAVYLLPRRGLVAVVVAGLVAAPIFRDVLERVFGYWYAPYVLLPSRMDALMYGVAVALIVRSEYAFAVAKRFRRALDVIALVILWSIIDNWDLTLWPASTSFALFHSTFGIMGAIVILRVFTYEKSTFNAIWRNSILAKIGLISYALYMYHQAVNGLVHGLLFNQEPTISEPAHLVAAIGVIAIATVLAALSYRYFERPIRQYGAALAARVSSTEAAPRALIPSKADRLT